MNWNSNDTKYILKRFVIYILICFAMFIIGIYKPKASTITGTWFDRSVTLYPSADNVDIGFSNWFSGYGEGYVVFSFTTEPMYSNYAINRAVSGVYVNTNKGIGYHCEVGNQNVYRDNSNSVPLYNAKCYVNLKSGEYLAGANVKVPLDSAQAQGLFIKTSYYITFVPMNTNDDVVNAINNANSVNAINNVNNSINNVNDSINNDNVTTSDADDFKNNQAFSDSSGLESVIQLPLNMINSLTSTCQPIQVTIPFIDYTGELPCMSSIYRSKFNTLYTIVKLVINGFFVYRLLLKIYELVHSAKQPDEDKLEVIEL